MAQIAFTAFAAGAATSLMPCALAGIPILINCVNRAGALSRPRSMGISALFALGASAVFVIFGIIFSCIGITFGESPLWHIILGILLILMALETWGIVCIIPHKLFHSIGKGLGGVFAAGLASGIISAPCSATALAAVLALPSRENGPAACMLIIPLFCLGHSLIALAAGCSASLARRLTEKHGKAAKILRIVIGSAVFALGIYIFVHAFVHI